MKPWTRWLQPIAVLAAMFVVVRTAVQAIRQGRWGPILAVAWAPGVIAAAWPGRYRRCAPRRRSPAG